ncbi:MAG: ROK family protein [Solirubrobacterales bacterium]
MLRRRTQKNKPVTPDPVDPSTIPEATVPATPDAEAEAAVEENPVEDSLSDDTPESTSDESSDLVEVAEDLADESADSEGSPEGDTLEEVPDADAPPEPTEQSRLSDPALAETPEARERAAKIPNVPASEPGTVDPPAIPLAPPAPPAAVAAASTPFEDPTPPAPEAPAPPVVTPPASANRLRAETRAATLTGGIDLGGTKIAAAVIGPKHEVLAYRRRPTPTTGGPADVIKAIATTMQEAAQDANVEAHQLRAVGVGAPGSVDSATGAVSGAGNLPGWSGSFPLGTALRDIIGTPVFVGNDVQVGTNAEFLLGAGAGYRSLLGVFWGTGVGGGIVLDGKPWRGRGRAGEIGHTLVKRGGAPNSNGLNGTVEAYAGRKAMQAKVEREMKKGRKTDLFKIMEKHGKTTLTSAVWAHALDHNDELATELLNRAVRALSAGIASAVNLLDVEAVVIGGGLGVRFADSLVPEIIDGMNAYLLDADNPPAIKVAGLGDEGGVIGASLLV